MSEERKTLILIDANALIHRMYHALPPLTSKDGEPAGALYGLANVLLKIIEERKPEYMLACFDRPEDTFRHQQDVRYKANRAETEDMLVPQLIKARELFRKFGIKTFELPGYEADDLIGTAANRFRKNKVKKVILTGDLDETQLVSDEDDIVVETFGKGIRETKIYDEAAVAEKFGVGPERVPDYKGLVGDSSDNIKGVAGVGPKTAGEFLAEFGTIEGIFVKIKEVLAEGDRGPSQELRTTQSDLRRFKKFIGQEKQALESKRLATINQKAPINLGNLAELKMDLDRKRLANYFGELGFGSLVKRVGGGEVKKEEKKAERSKRKKKGTEAIFILEGGKITEEEKKSGKLKVGFNLKEAVKGGLKGPYFDLGIGFWLLDPDAGNYSPEYAVARFMKREWEDNEENLAAVWEWVEEELEENNLKEVFEKIEMKLLPVLARMEERGVEIDREQLEKLKTEAKKEIKELEKKIYKASGKEFNINSPKQLGKILFEDLKIDKSKIKKTAGGSISTNYENLMKVKDEHEVVPLLLEYREMFKIYSTYIEPILEMTGEEGRLHTTYLQTGTGTGRLSSEHPNLQNIPQGARLAQPLRKAFVAGRGRRFLSFDYSQMELRILATVAHDGKMIQAFKEGRDIHNETASGVFGVPFSEVTREMRRVAKVLNFGVIYGMGPRAFAQTAGITQAEAKEKIREYFDSFPAIERWQEHIKREARTNGFVQTMSGRRRLIPEIQSGSPRFIAQGERVAMNMPIQGLEADIMKLAMIKVEEEIERWGWGGEVKILLSIHDDLLFEVEAEKVEEARGAIRKIMERAFPLAVPLKVEIKEGKNWGEMRAVED